MTKELSEKMVGSHWSMTLWMEGEDAWGAHFVCQELPELNSVETGVIDTEKTIDNEMFGGKMKVGRG